MITTPWMCDRRKERVRFIQNQDTILGSIQHPASLEDGPGFRLAINQIVPPTLHILLEPKNSNFVEHLRNLSPSEAVAVTNTAFLCDSGPPRSSSRIGLDVRRQFTLIFFGNQNIHWKSPQLTLDTISRCHNIEFAAVRAYMSYSDLQ